MKIIKVILSGTFFALKALLYVVIAILLWKCSGENKMPNDTWTGFIYPDKNNLFNDINIGSFENLDACRIAAINRLDEIDAYYSGDYECGLNCNFSGRKPYTCHDTRR